MKLHQLHNLFLIILFSISFNVKSQELIGDAKIFEPGIISLEDTWDEYISFSPDGKTLTFTRSGDSLSHYGKRIYFSYFKDGKWSIPELAPFSSYFTDQASSFSPDGNTLFFASNRPVERGYKRDLDIWFSSKKFDGTWGEATRLNNTINSDKYSEGHPTIARNNNLYFVRHRRGEETDIYVSKYINGVYQEAVKLEGVINTSGPDSHCYIDQDERYLIYAPTGRENGFGGGDIYISYNNNGIWSASINLGNQINSNYYEYSAKPGPNNSLYFTKASFDRDNPKKADIYFIRIKNLL